MKRREFLGAAAATGLAFLGSGIGHAASPGGPKQGIELRLYTFSSPDKQKAFEQFLADAMIPALNRLGITPVGVFQAFKGDFAKTILKPDTPHLFLVLPHSSAESLITLADQLAADQAYQQKAQAILDAPRSDPAFTACQSSLLLSFDAVPQVEIPTKAPSRVMQLRIYQAHNDLKAARKEAMFSAGGEIAIFRKCGMAPVFGGRALAGERFPNVTYMLGFDDEAAMAKGWQTFVRHPDWQKLRGDATYKDTDPIVIVNLVLKPAPGSQI